MTAAPKRGPGRPGIAPGAGPAPRITVRLAPADHDRLTGRAEAEGVPVGELARQMIVNALERK